MQSGATEVEAAGSHEQHVQARQQGRGIGAAVVVDHNKLVALGSCTNPMSPAEVTPVVHKQQM